VCLGDAFDDCRAEADTCVVGAYAFGAAKKRLDKRGNLTVEGIFVEYKRDWTSRKVARVVASFANTYGGTLMVGVEAESQAPMAVPSIEGDPGQIEERVGEVLRRNIAVLGSKISAPPQAR
jgi:hypothetical protein